MKNEKRKVREAARFVKEKTGASPDIGIITGTGLGGIPKILQMNSVIPYRTIPHFLKTGVISHTGDFLSGTIAGKPCAVLNGRVHLYEGHNACETVFSVRFLKELGVRILIITNAAGGINPHYNTGDIMLISDHINLTGENPLIGPNDDEWGDRFPEMSFAYDTKLKEIAITAAVKKGITLKSGVYAGLKGPSLETPAEVRFLRTIGADAVGFSTVMEVIAAVHLKMRVLGLSAITNIHTPDAPAPADVNAIIETAGAVSGDMGRIIESVIESENP